MATFAPYLLTSVEGVPVIIKANSTEDHITFAVKGSRGLSEAVAKKTIENQKWTQETNRPEIAELINRRFGEHEIWIQHKIAFKGSEEGG